MDAPFSEMRVSRPAAYQTGRGGAAFFNRELTSHQPSRCRFSPLRTVATQDAVAGFCNRRLLPDRSPGLPEHPLILGPVASAIHATNTSAGSRFPERTHP